MRISEVSLLHKHDVRSQRSLGGPGTLGVVTMVTVPWGMVQWQHGTFIIN